MSERETYRVYEPSGSERYAATVTDVYASTAGERFRDEEDPDRRVLVVEFEATNGTGKTFKADKIMTLMEPPTKKSSLLKWKRTYGEYPEPGQEIKIHFNGETRRWDVDLN